jgi:opacity protein-like surface antigen
MVNNRTATTALAAALLACSVAAPAQADPTGLQLTIRMQRGVAYGSEVGPNRFQLGRTANGHWVVDLALSWNTTDGSTVWGHEASTVLDGNGNSVYSANQSVNGFAESGHWKFALKMPGQYTYVVDVDTKQGQHIHGEQPFTVDP